LGILNTGSERRFSGKWVWEHPAYLVEVIHGGQSIVKSQPLNRLVIL
jgi:hypothetical protein